MIKSCALARHCFSESIFQDVPSFELCNSKQVIQTLRSVFDIAGAHQSVICKVAEENGEKKR